ncbi:MAG: DinB family protein [Pseudomonadota bacterium]
MITPDYVQMMARYNRWQNEFVVDNLAAQSHEILTKDRKAFFGSILGTLNHILWADVFWMSRFTEHYQRPEQGVVDSPKLHATFDAYRNARKKMDEELITWADGLTVSDVTGDLTWFSGSLGREAKTALGKCITHMFNHQTHHRGQVHAMMTGADIHTSVTDLAFLPEDFE